MKVVYYTFVDPCVHDYLTTNKSLHKIKHPITFLCSNKSHELVKELYPNAICLHSPNDLQQKFIHMVYTEWSCEDMEEMEDTVFVKIDLDTIIFDYERLKEFVNSIGKNQMIGNTKFSNGLLYVRGAVNALRASVLRPEILRPSGDHMDVDIWLSKQLGNRIMIIDRPIFEISESYSGKMPCWHPIQYKDKRKKFECFLSSYSKVESK